MVSHIKDLFISILLEGKCAEIECSNFNLQNRLKLLE